MPDEVGGSPDGLQLDRSAARPLFAVIVTRSHPTLSSPFVRLGDQLCCSSDHQALSWLFGSNKCIAWTTCVFQLLWSAPIIGSCKDPAPAFPLRDISCHFEIVRKGKLRGVNEGTVVISAIDDEGRVNLCLDSWKGTCDLANLECHDRNLEY